MSKEIDDYLDMYGDYNLTTKEISRETYLDKWEVEEELDKRGYSEVLGEWMK